MLKVSMGRLDEVHIWTLTGLFSLQNKSIRSKATVREAGTVGKKTTRACRLIGGCRSQTREGGREVVPAASSRSSATLSALVSVKRLVLLVYFLLRHLRAMRLQQCF
ncbi:hypothetical protein DPX16_4070 [Anabarilius grahami]|uniref:Uncharacterized protein n=1 Tax=Anabarilius grahami TaxID=495550 RepID=A0A3N0XY89_ANAGA|nr:hypothetical protein DPX16_4070 [Anabarilius grahami]